VVTRQALLSLLTQEWDQRSEKGSGLQLPAATVTTAGVDPAGVRAEGMQHCRSHHQMRIRRGHNYLLEKDGGIRGEVPGFHTEPWERGDSPPPRIMA